MADKLVTYAIPCYNAAEYMDQCIESILACQVDDIEILIVDDGSTEDDTLQKAQDWEERRPGIIRAIHQENGGHGAAIMKALDEAAGTYFKVVDSDDWLDDEANRTMLSTLRTFEDDPLDLMLVNYVYEHTVDGTQELVRYHRILPQEHVFSWEDIGRFPPTKYILMHSVVYRTQMLRESGLQLPRHTFYVDNIFVYVPLPLCKRIYYLDVDLYHYFIGREDQSVNESVMIGRIDQQLRITRIMIDAFNLETDVESDKLRSYMLSYLAMMMTICTVFTMLSDRDDKEELRQGIWNHLQEGDPYAYRKIRRSVLGRGTNLPGDWGDKTMIRGYRLTQKIFKFN
ncbi:MAG: glycosyltransferase [Coriobacteriaceae bacterium]|nr:glycosyltransferase [Coriobacteriaceae bacterium]